MARLRATYDEMPAHRLALGCLIGAGAAAEKAFNRYIAAANTWGDASPNPAAGRPPSKERCRTNLGSCLPLPRRGAAGELTFRPPPGPGRKPAWSS